jgi:hypothetical protein
MLDQAAGEFPMSKHQLIEQIRQLNRSAAETFLVHFNEQALENYLKRLSLARDGRGRTSRWVRPGDMAATMTRAH